MVRMNTSVRKWCDFFVTCNRLESEGKWKSPTNARNLYVLHRRKRPLGKSAFYAFCNRILALYPAIPGSTFCIKSATLEALVAERGATLLSRAVDIPPETSYSAKHFSRPGASEMRNPKYFWTWIGAFRNFRLALNF